MMRLPWLPSFLSLSSKMFSSMVNCKIQHAGHLLRLLCLRENWFCGQKIISGLIIGREMESGLSMFVSDWNISIRIGLSWNTLRTKKCLNLNLL